MVCETEEDARVAEDAVAELVELEVLHRRPKCLRIVHLPTPQSGGAYEVIPYSNKINWALDQTQADAVVYLDNGSMPAPEKYEVMLAGIDAGHQAVYCTQEFTGFASGFRGLVGPVEQPKGRLNFTQVMHTVGPERWTLDMKWANPDWADGLFFLDLIPRVGLIHPVGDPDKPLDFHHIPSPAAGHLTP